MFDTLVTFTRDKKYKRRGSFLVRVKMPRPKKPSTGTVKRIYSVLCGKPKCFEDIVKDSGLHRNTVGSVLEMLVKERMLLRHKEGRKTIYEIDKSDSTLRVWQIPWIASMMTEDDWEKKWRRVEKELKTHSAEDMLKDWINHQKELMVDFILSPQNREIIKTLENAGIDLNAKSIKELWRIIQAARTTPICPDCLKNKDVVFCIQTADVAGEIVCPKCGLTLEALPVDEPLAHRRQKKP